MKLCNHEIVVPVVDPGNGKVVQHRCVCGKVGKVEPDIMALINRVTRQWPPSQYKIGIHGPTPDGSTIVITDPGTKAKVRTAKGKSLEAALKNVLKRLA